ncbi:hypothetical protein BLA29_006071 [Euroglyphus maynei]|uniref:Uncharacterized protein n=1 Tax=Euroglyphus maynei TaxID=6958 RepID=A0A1Y3AMF4_EURMA|nr:hypothetical protein BLA29_006071 [Euroglyphus maynei]
MFAGEQVACRVHRSIYLSSSQITASDLIFNVHSNCTCSYYITRFSFLPTVVVVFVAVVGWRMFHS